MRSSLEVAWVNKGLFYNPWFSCLVPTHLLQLSGHPFMSFMVSVQSFLLFFSLTSDLYILQRESECRKRAFFVTDHFIKAFKRWDVCLFVYFSSCSCHESIHFLYLISLVFCYDYLFVCF